eukprot:3977197-Amphidinium_carterae.1
MYHPSKYHIIRVRGVENAELCSPFLLYCIHMEVTCQLEACLSHTAQSGAHESYHTKVPEIPPQTHV